MDINSISSLNLGSITPLEQSSNRKKASALDQVGESFSNVLNSLSESQANSDNLLQTPGNRRRCGSAHRGDCLGRERCEFSGVAMAIRDKLVDAYREVMRMSV